jgi:hypothetical protein
MTVGYVAKNGMEWWLYTMSSKMSEVRQSWFVSKHCSGLHLEERGKKCLEIQLLWNVARLRCESLMFPATVASNLNSCFLSLENVWIEDGRLRNGLWRWLLFLKRYVMPRWSDWRKLWARCQLYISINEIKCYLAGLFGAEEEREWRKCLHLFWNLCEREHRLDCIKPSTDLSEEGSVTINCTRIYNDSCTGSKGFASILLILISEACCSVVHWGSILHTGRSWVRDPMRSSNVLSLPNPSSSTRPWIYSVSNRNKYQKQNKYFSIE